MPLDQFCTALVRTRAHTRNQVVAILSHHGLVYSRDRGLEIMRWKRILIITVVASVLALYLYAVSLGHVGIPTMQTTETDRAECREALRSSTSDFTAASIRGKNDPSALPALPGSRSHSV